MKSMMIETTPYGAALERIAELEAELARYKSPEMEAMRKAAKDLAAATDVSFARGYYPKLRRAEDAAVALGRSILSEKTK